MNNNIYKKRDKNLLFQDFGLNVTHNLLVFVSDLSYNFAETKISVTFFYRTKSPNHV